MIRCQDPSKGFMVIHCDSCKKDYIIHFSCNSRICPRCGNKYVKKWVENVCERMYDVDYSHIVFTLPRDVWNLIGGKWECISELYAATFRVLRETMCKSAKQKITPGMIEAGHTFGKDIKWNVHFHSVCTEGGLTKNGKWKNVYFLPYRIMRLKWKQYSLKIIKKYIGLSFEEQITLESVYHQYRDGFDIRRIKGKMKKKELAGYIARYIRHPAISDRRIVDYTGKNVTIICEDKSNKVSWNEKFNVNEFISRLVRHIPPKGFQVVRHYGIYSKKKYVKKKIQRDKQEIIQNYFCLKCPQCGERAKIVFIWQSNYGDKPPPRKIFGSVLNDWIS